MREEKKRLRVLMKARLSEQTRADRDRRSHAVAVKLLKEPAFIKARHVLFYVSMPEEVDTLELIDRAVESGKKVSAPRVDTARHALDLFEIRSRKELKPGALGILEPDPDRARRSDASEIDCVIVPGLAFDRSGRRLGRGAGFYDRFLATLRPTVAKIGLAFSFQLTEEELPEESHDRRLDKVLTD